MQLRLRGIRLVCVSLALLLLAAPGVQAIAGAGLAVTPSEEVSGPPTWLLVLGFVVLGGAIAFHLVRSRQDKKHVQELMEELQEESSTREPNTYYTRDEG